MAATGRFDRFHSEILPARQDAPLPFEGAIVRATLTGVVMVCAVALVVAGLWAIEGQVAQLMGDLARLTEPRDANGFFTLSAQN